MGKDYQNRPSIGRVNSALERSKVRRDAYDYLCSIYPRKAFVPELVEGACHSASNLKNVILGGGSYPVEDALISLCVAEMGCASLYKKTFESFGLTEWGFSIKDQLANYRSTHTHSVTYSVPGLSRTRRLTEMTKG